MSDAGRPIRQPEWATGELDLAAYLERIRHPGPVAATGAVLRSLHRAHVAADPDTVLAMVSAAPTAEQLEAETGGEAPAAAEESTEEPVGLVERVCAIDIGKAGLVVCVRIPHGSKPGRRVQEVREYATTTPALLGLADWLHDQRIELVSSPPANARDAAPWRTGARRCRSKPAAGAICPVGAARRT